MFRLRFIVIFDDDDLSVDLPKLQLKNVTSAPEVAIVGAGPAGLFAALRLIELGFRPIVLERGKSVRERRRDIAEITKRGNVNPESNYCFGEGGAGTFSDGKLYTRSKKRGSIERVLGILVEFGASPDILIDAHPHIGTNKLPKVVEAIRDAIQLHGGEVRFESKVTSFLKDLGGIRGVGLSDGTEVRAHAVILANGHSARDIFRLLQKEKVLLEQKPFAMGVRVEHPQSLIDQIHYHQNPRAENLPAASYSLVAQCMGRGVFSFCMCPGGIICPAATDNSEVVVNGWSPSKRNSYFANSGIVVQVLDEDLKNFTQHGVLAGMMLQSELENRAAVLGGGAQKAPASRLTDFIDGKTSSTLPSCSYLPGIQSSDLYELFPKAFSSRLAAAFKAFEMKRKGYLSEEAVVLGVESRTSSPIRIVRDKTTLMSPSLEGLFPCGEGAGFAGGIMSAAMDGENVASALAQHYKR